MQGLASGGEMPTALVFVAEAAPPGRRGLCCAAVQATGVGSLLASAVASVLHVAFSAETIDEWAWRLPFASGALLLLVGQWLRKVVRETHSGGGDGSRSRQVSGLPFIQVLRQYPLTILRIACANAVGAVGYYWAFVWLPSLARDNQVAHPFMISTAAMVLNAAVILCAGHLADRCRGRFGAVAVVGAVGTACVAVQAASAYSNLHEGDDMTRVLAMHLILALALGIFIGPIQAWMVSSLRGGAHVRCSQFAVAYNLCVGLFSGSAPAIATALKRIGAAAPALYLIAVAGLSIFTIVVVELCGQRPDTASAPSKTFSEDTPAPAGHCGGSSEPCATEPK